MRLSFSRLFNVYPGEEKKALMIALLGFVWALAVTLGQKFSDAIFLIHIGAESLPTAYMITAIIMVFLALFLLHVFHTFTSQRIFLVVLSIGICFYGGIYILLQTVPEANFKALYFSLKVFGTIFFSVVTMAFWTFVDQFFDLQDGKRLFCLFSSSVFLGVATTGLVMRSGVVEFHQVVALIIALLLVASYGVYSISKKLEAVPDEHSLDASSSLGELSLWVVFREIISSKFAIILMLGNFFNYVLMSTTEYNYMSAFEDYFATPSTLPLEETDEAALTHFLGSALVVVSLLNLLIGLFFYSRFVRRFGVASLLTVSPMLLVITFTGWQFSDMLLFPLLGFLVVEGTLYVIDDSNFNLLLNAVPSKLKYKVRITIESFFEPAGLLVSSLLLSLPFVNSHLIGLILSIGWLLTSLTLKTRYGRAIYENLAENAIHFQKVVRDWLKLIPRKTQKEAEFRLLSLLKQEGDEEAQLFAIETLLSFEDEAILKQILQQTGRLSNEATPALLNVLAKSKFMDHPLVIDTLFSWLNDPPTDEVRGEIHFYLARLGLLHPEKALTDLESVDLLLRGAAIVSLKKSWAHLSPSTAAWNRTLAAKHLQELLDSSIEEEVRVGIQVVAADGSPHDVEILLPYLRNPSATIARASAMAISQIADRQCARHAKELISLLRYQSDHEFRIACLTALGKMIDSSLVKELILSSLHFRPNERLLTEQIIFRLGLRTVPVLLAITKDTSLHDRCRVLAGRILGRLAPPQLRANLKEILQIESEKAFFYLYHANTIRDRYPTTDLSLLQEALLTRFHSIQDFIIQLLGVAGEVEDCELLSRCLRSRNSKVRSQVIEALEKSCEHQLLRLLYPLLGAVPEDEQRHLYLKQNRDPMNLEELLNYLSNSSSQLDQIVSATFKYRLDMPNWRDSLRQQMMTQEELFHHFAYELLET